MCMGDRFTDRGGVPFEERKWHRFVRIQIYCRKPGSDLHVQNFALGWSGKWDIFAYLCVSASFFLGVFSGLSREQEGDLSALEKSLLLVKMSVCNRDLTFLGLMKRWKQTTISTVWQCPDCIRKEVHNLDSGKRHLLVVCDVRIRVKRNTPAVYKGKLKLEVCSVPFRSVSDFRTVAVRVFGFTGGLQFRLDAACARRSYGFA